MRVLLFSLLASAYAGCYNDLTAQGGTASASSELTGYGDKSPPKAFDGSTPSEWHSAYADPGVTLAWDSNSDYTVTGYTLTPRTGVSPTQFAGGWTFSASADGISWTDLDSTSGHTQGSSPVTRTFTSAGPFRHFKWTFTTMSYSPKGYAAVGEAIIAGCDAAGPNLCVQNSVICPVPDCQSCNPGTGLCDAVNEGNSCASGAGTCNSGSCILNTAAPTVAPGACFGDVTSQAGSIYASSTLTGHGDKSAGNAIDGNTASEWHSTYDTPPNFLTWESSSSGYSVTSYTLTPRTGVWPTQFPGAWVFEGSNDGTTWTTIDTTSGHTQGNSPVTRSFAATPPYARFRFKFTTLSYSPKGYAAVGELSITGCAV